MNFAILLTNYNRIEDGIGDGASKIYSLMPKDVKVVFYSGLTLGMSKLKRIFANEMTAQISKLIYDIKRGAVLDAVIIEYPFDEYNYRAIVKIKELAKLCKQRKILLVLRLHEYFRTRPIRKFYIRCLLCYIDFVFVPDSKLKRFVEQTFHKTAEIINVPSNVKTTFGSTNLSEKEHKMYSFFGLINRTKAFDEMMGAWKRFFEEKNDKELQLHIITASTILKEELGEFNVVYHQKASEGEVDRLLSKSTFCILPIKPSVSFNSGSFKASIDHGNIVIGHFDNDMDVRGFSVNARGNSEEDLLVGLENSAKLVDSGVVQSYISRCVNYSSNFSPNKSAQLIYTYMTNWLSETRGKR